MTELEALVHELRLWLDITEHRGHVRTCPTRATVTRAAIPEPIAAHLIGPRLAAMMSYRVGRHHLSIRRVQEFVEDALGVPVSLGMGGTATTSVAFFVVHLIRDFRN